MSEAPRHTVLYDDACPLCTFQMKMLTWLDWFHVARLLPLSGPGAQTLVPTISAEQLREAIHCVTPEGAVHRGARAIRFLSLRLPLAVPLALILWIPGIIWLAERFYAWVSRNRQLLSRLFGCKEACAILPERKREGDELGDVRSVESPR